MNIKRSIALICGIICLCLAGLFLWGKMANADFIRPSPQKLLDAQAIAILKGATHVDTLRIATPMMLHKKIAPGDPHLARFFVLGHGRPLGHAQGIQMVNDLLEPKNYPSYGSKCVANPGVAFRFWRGKESVLIAVCYGCGIVEAITLDPQSQVVTSGDSEFSAGLLVPEANHGFPNDPVVKSL